MDLKFPFGPSSRPHAACSTDALLATREGAGSGGRPLSETQAADADAYLGKVLREAKPSARTGRAAGRADGVFQFLELRYKVEPHNLTGRVVKSTLDELNRPRASVDLAIAVDSP